MFSLKTNDSVHLVQITDTHLNEPEDGHLLGMQTLHSLQCVLDRVRTEQSHLDALLVTGDLSQDGSLQSYQHLQKALTAFSCPSFWLEGNHDNPAHLNRMVDPQQSGNQHLERLIHTPHWQIIMLNSQVPGKVYGHLADDQLQLLEQALSQQPQRHTLVCFHHHPVEMDCDWIDGIGINNAADFWQVIDRHDNVRAVLWGHVHQDSDRMRGDVRLLSTPSTCVQFEPHTHNFSVDHRAPGYRQLTLHADGRIDTVVSRVDDIEFEVDYSVKGY